MKPPSTQLPVPDIESVIVTVREQRVILAPDLASVYGVPTKALIHEAAIVDVLQRIIKILDPPPPPPEPPPPKIGFHVREDAVPYRIRRRSAR